MLHHHRRTAVASTSADLALFAPAWASGTNMSTQVIMYALGWTLHMFWTGSCATTQPVNTRSYHLELRCGKRQQRARYRPGRRS